ncbi:Hypothetical protein PHPALM_5013 [Phytophthora palmivora]|uniref:RxLR effector protein n=1 Tax=Phytophthora palmivora TaxID=4796 RepID=A0A2P4YIF6_9STRA|nr:Hypothetical protein PHPALM_5013 [Phytophthora palmivora]
MRVQSVLLFVFIASTAFAAADSTTTNIATVQSNELSFRWITADRKQVKRSLRRYDPDELDSEDEEDRGAFDKVDDVVTKLDDVAGKQQQLTAKLDALILKNLDEFSMTGDLAKKLSGKYEDAYKLSLPTLKQLDEIEILRVDDIATYSKETGKSMRRVIEPFNGIKIAPEKFLESHVGRDLQRYDPVDGSRLLSASVVSRPKSQGGGDVLLISSSNPNKGDWLLPKGGWDKGEDVKRAAMREVIEEGGVRSKLLLRYFVGCLTRGLQANAQLLHGLGKSKFSEGDKKYTYYSYMMKANTVYGDWAESVRYRIWVSYDDAIALLAKRPHMVNVVKEAKKINGKIKARDLPEADPKMRKFTLDLE